MSQRILLIGGCGYIGSYLYPRLLAEGYNVAVCDDLRRGNPAQIPVHYARYQDLPTKALVHLDAVLWFAGHSSVGQSVNDPSGALANNCLDLYGLGRCLPDRVKLIYASTASLYSIPGRPVVPSAETSLIQIPDQNAYDSTKFAFDYIAKNHLPRFYGLRMGTLAGHSPNLRSDLVFNAMNLAARRQGVIFLKNSASMRTILYLQDLWVLVKNLIQHNHQAGFYNAGSHTASMAELAQGIASTWLASIEYHGETSTYSFALDCTLMKTICRHELSTCSLQEASRQFIQEHESSPTHV